MKSLYQISALLGFLFLMGCEATLQSETDRWLIANTKGQQFIDRYPNMAEFIKTDILKAEKMKSMADEEEDPEVELKTLQAANAIVRGKVYMGILRIETVTDRITDNLNKITNEYDDEIDSDRVKGMFKDAKHIIKKAERNMSKSPKTRDQAIYLIAESRKELNRVDKRLDDYIEFRIKEINNQTPVQIIVEDSL